MLLSLAYILLLGLALGSLFAKLRLPALLGMLIAGIILGGSGLNILSPSVMSISLELRQIALIIILLRAGLALNLTELRQVGLSAVLLCFVPACFEIVGITLIAPKLLGISTVDAVLMGTVVAAVSPAVIVPKMLTLKERGIGTDKSIPQMIMAAGAVDDIFVIVLFTIFMSLSSGGEFEVGALGEIPISIISGLAVGIAVGWGVVQIFKRTSLRDSAKVLILLSMGFMLLAVESWLKEVIAISGLLAVMAMGGAVLKLYEPVAVRMSKKFNKLWVGAEILLFVLVGATVDIDYAMSAGLSAVGVIFFALAFRMAGVFVATLSSPLTLSERVFCMIAYMPKATVQAAIGALPLAAGLGCGDIILTVAVLSILITAPLGALGIDTFSGRLLKKQIAND